MRYTLVDFLFFFFRGYNKHYIFVGWYFQVWCDFCVVYSTIKRWEWEGATTIHITCNYYMQNAMILLFDTSFFFFLNYRKLCDLGGRRRKVQTFGGGYMFLFLILYTRIRYTRAFYTNFSFSSHWNIYSFEWVYGKNFCGSSFFFFLCDFIWILFLKFNTKLLGQNIYKYRKMYF